MDGAVLRRHARAGGAGVKQVHGWAFPDADGFMANEMKADGSYQAAHLSKALEYVTDWSVAVSGGAHVGTWTRILSQRFASVIAVEPSPDTFEALVENMRQFDCANVELHNVALGNQPGFVHMELEPRAEALRNTGGRYVQPGGEIQVVTIDSWNLPTLGFLKLDVEGSEPLAIAGGAQTIKRCKPIILFENKGFWQRFGLKRDAPQTLLQSLGYQELAVVGCDRIWGPR